MLLHEAEQLAVELRAPELVLLDEEEHHQISEIGTAPGEDDGDLSDKGCEIPIRHRPDPLPLLVGSAITTRTGKKASVGRKIPKDGARFPERNTGETPAAGIRSICEIQRAWSGSGRR
jgi:hypothetical protein